MPPCGLCAILCASVILRGEISARSRKAASVRIWRRIAAACFALCSDSASLRQLMQLVCYPLCYPQKTDKKTAQRVALA